MSYLVLARKWRPQTFAEVVGQEAVVRTLQNGLLRNRVAHAMIFSGVRGVGKTTLARIMAKALNCRGPAEERPCNRCESCREITSGAAVDLQEIDGASNRGIQEIRELKENIRFFPAKNPYKVIIIDEVHMLTQEAFNALLKTLEEPPEHVYFMFATTELHKVPVTILSRCQRYELKRVPFARLLAFFEKIAASEEVTISARALELIAREADGSVRDGLSLLDHVFSFGGEEVTDEDVVQVLGLVDRRIFAQLARALLAGDLAVCFDLLEKTYGAGLDLKRFSADLLDYFRSLLICRTSPDPQKLLDVSDQEFAELQDLAAAHSRETISLAFQLLFAGCEKMQYSSHPRLVLETAFIRMIQAGQVIPAATLLERMNTLLAESGGTTALKPVEPPQRDTTSRVPVPDRQSGPEGHGQPARPRPAPTPAKSEVPTPTAAPKKKEGQAPAAESVPEPVPAEKRSEPEKRNREPEKKRAEEGQMASLHQPRGKDVRKNWNGFVDYVKERKPWMAQVLRICENPRQDGDDLLVRFENPSYCTLLQKAENLTFLTEWAQDFFQKELRVKIGTRKEKEGDEEETEQNGPQAERRALANDPLVQMTTDVFGGQVAAIRTGPRFR